MFSRPVILKAKSTLYLGNESFKTDKHRLSETISLLIFVSSVTRKISKHSEIFSHSYDKLLNNKMNMKQSSF